MPPVGRGRCVRVGVGGGRGCWVAVGAGPFGDAVHGFDCFCVRMLPLGALGFEDVLAWWRR